jgi:outer membrane protein OmpA-like peptidoglycan-associated protein
MVAYAVGGLKVAIGRAEHVELPVRAVRGRLTGMLFETDKTFLLPSAMRGIRNLRLLYDEYPRLEVLVTGHTDTVGATDYNQGLSEERAEAVAAFLTDQADTWLGWYQGKPHSRPWGVREDQHMLATLGHYAGPVDGQAGTGTQGAYRTFQESKGLPASGFGDQATRRALIVDYMAQDGTSLPAGTPIQLHGCGEHHNEVPTGDNVDEPKNRRVEVFLFDGAIQPPPRKPCQSCPEYPEWLKQTYRTVDLDLPPGSLTAMVVDDQDAPLAEARVELSGITMETGQTDGSGRCHFPELIAGRYRVSGYKDGYQAAGAWVDVEPGPHPEAPKTEKSSFVEGDEGGDGSGTGAPDVTLELQAQAPVIKSFGGWGTPVPAGTKPTATDRVFFPQGGGVHLEWVVEGDPDEIVLDPGARKLSGTSVELAATDLPLDGVLRLTAKKGGVASTPATVKVTGILDFWLETDTPYPDDKPQGKLFEKDMTTEVDKLHGKDGAYKDYAKKVGVWFGGVTPKSELVFHWKVVGAAHAQIEVDVFLQGKTDVTDRTRKLSEPQHSMTDKAVARLDADLVIYEDDAGTRGKRRASSVLLVKEDLPDPKFAPGNKGFEAQEHGSPLRPGIGATWADLELAWGLVGDAYQCKVDITVTDKSGTVNSYPAKSSTDKKLSGVVKVDQIGKKALTGKLTAVAKLTNLAGDLVDSRTLTIKMDGITGKIVVHKPDGSLAMFAKVTLTDAAGTVHKGQVENVGHAKITPIAGGSMKIIAELDGVGAATRTVDHDDDFTETLTLVPLAAAQHAGTITLAAATSLAAVASDKDTVLGDKARFELEVKEVTAGAGDPDEVILRVKNKSYTVREDRFAKPSAMTSIGTHAWLWDGSNDRGAFDTNDLLGDLTAELEIRKLGFTPVVETLALKGVAQGLPWQATCDTKTNRMTVTVTYEATHSPLVDAALSSKVHALVDKGVSRFWSRNLTLKGVGWNLKAMTMMKSTGAPNVHVVPEIPVVLERACNLGVLAPGARILIPVASDFPKSTFEEQQMEDTGAHELGHSILLEAVSSDWSLKHKGTSSATQSALPGNPYPTAPTEIDLMKYSSDSTLPSDWYTRTHLAEEDAKGLLASIRVFLAKK